MARVGLRDGKAVLDALAHLRHAARVVERFASVAAVADHVEPAVPRRR
jgi:hypothetical protein